ncbi:MAG: MerR family transcriptional regulator [Alcaligenes sp.]
MKISLEQLVDQTGISGRTIRYYIQKGLIPKPFGEKRGAWYTQVHLADLLRIRQWQEAGLSLDAIAGLLQAKQEVPVAPRRSGTIEVRSHLVVADGIELSVSPERAGLTQEQVRRLFREVNDLLTSIKNPPEN